MRKTDFDKKALKIWNIWNKMTVRKSDMLDIM